MPTNTGDLTLLDITQRYNSDAIVGLVEDVIYNAPELELFPALTKPATTYRTTKRIQYPNAQFSAAGSQGVILGKSVYEQQVASLHNLEVPLEIPENIIDADEGEIGDLMTQEGMGAIRAAFITLGKQIWYGQNADANGFLGVQSVIGSDPNFTLSANANSANTPLTNGTTSSAYLVRLENDGLSVAVGKGGKMDLRPWQTQQITASGSGNSRNVYMAYVTAFRGYFGLTFPSTYAAWRIYNIDHADPLTDALAANLMAIIPMQFRRNLRWFMTRDAAYTLQKSRTAINYQPAFNGGGAPAFAPAPTMLEGIPITITDSLSNPINGVGGETS